MSAADLLSRLDGVKQTGRDRWLARCPAHEDRRASLSVRELDDGRVLVHCFAECSVQEVIAAAGLEIAALFPAREIEHGKPERRPFPALDVLRAVSFEALVAAVAAGNLARGATLSHEDRERLNVAARRLRDAAEVAGAR